MVHIRTWTKFIILIVLLTFLIIGAISFFYKPIYSVTLNGELIGYSDNKSKLQEKVNEYIEKGNGDNIAFVDISSLPEYKLCLLKKDIVANNDEIFEKIISNGTPYYRFYAITVNNEEKAYVADFSQAESVVNQLKEKNSNNKDSLSIVEKYDTSTKEFTSVEKCVADLYVKKQVVKKSTRSSFSVSYASSVNTSSKKVELGISLIRPTSGTVTSRFGSRWGKNHKGLDIGAPKGTPIKAAASGTVITASSGYNGGYGNYIVISHGNGIQTAY